jgi:hypothetical protein
MAHLHANMGPAWTRIAAALGNRTENSVKKWVIRVHSLACLCPGPVI